MKMKTPFRHFPILIIIFCLASCGTTSRLTSAQRSAGKPKGTLIPAEKFVFNSFVDCNMATVWVKDTFRIFPGKYGEDPLWGEAHELKYASGLSVDHSFGRSPEEFTEPDMPGNVLPGEAGLHGAVWFETVYKDPGDKSEKTLYALYHNENYPSTLPFNPVSGEGYREFNWPQGLLGPDTKTAVCRIGIMKSVDGGLSWVNKGIVLEDLMPRLILKPHNTGINFAGGVGDPSAVANGDYLYIFFGEYGYPGQYRAASYNPELEWSGQCISMARIPLASLDNPVGQAKRWGGKAFDVSPDGIGKPIKSIQIALDEGGAPTSSPTAKYYWGPSVSWNTYLNCWVMLMAKAEGPSWKGSSIYISFNRNKDLDAANNSQEWSEPELLLDKPGHTIWYPSLQPFANNNDREEKYTSVKLGQKARLFYKDNFNNQSPYLSEYHIEFGMGLQN